MIIVAYRATRCKRVEDDMADNDAADNTTGRATCRIWAFPCVDY